MTFDQIEVFEMIVEKGSFKAAAAELRKAQPTLSIAIKKLEEEFDLLLFNRDTYRPTLTEAGQVFYTWAHQCLRGYRELNTVARELGMLKVEPNLTLVVDPLTRFEAIEGIFEECLAKSVPTELTLRSEILGTGMDLLLEQKADFAVAPRLSKHKDIESMLFETMELIPCIAGTRVSADSNLRLGGLENITQIVVRSAVKTAKNDSFGVLDKGKKCFVTDHAMKRKLILEGFGWGRLARHEVEKELKEGRLVRLETEGLEAVTIDLYLMRNRLKPMGPVAKSIWQSLLRTKAHPPRE